MSLRHLSTGKSAQFFRTNPRRRLSIPAATQIIRTVSATRSGRIWEEAIREPLAVDSSAVQITYVYFPVESEPTFLDKLAVYMAVVGFHRFKAYGFRVCGGELTQLLLIATEFSPWHRSAN